MTKSFLQPALAVLFRTHQSEPQSDRDPTDDLLGGWLLLQGPGSSCLALNLNTSCSSSSRLVSPFFSPSHNYRTADSRYTQRVIATHTTDRLSLTGRPRRSAPLSRVASYWLPCQPRPREVFVEARNVRPTTEGERR